MTVDSHPDAPSDTVADAERLHETLVNQLGYDTDMVLVTAHSDGVVSSVAGEPVGTPIEE
jgi:hypothetical protein